MEPNYEYFNSVIKKIIAIYPGLKIYRTKILSNDNHCIRYNDDDLEEVNESCTTQMRNDIVI